MQKQETLLYEHILKPLWIPDAQYRPTYISPPQVFKLF